jgi:uncharacterized protein YutE (UPF0331/DUF86 family)
VRRIVGYSVAFDFLCLGGGPVTDRDASSADITDARVENLSADVYAELLHQLTLLEIRASQSLEVEERQTSAEASSSEVARAIRLAFNDSNPEVVRRRTIRRGLALALGVVVPAVVVSILVMLFSKEHSATIYTSIVPPVAALMGVALGFYFGTTVRESSTTEQLDSIEAQLIEAVDALERQIRMTVARTKGVRSDEPFSSLVRDLLERGVWQEQDAQDFRRVMKARNEVVHSGKTSDQGTRQKQTQLARDLLRELIALDSRRAG